MGATCSRWPVIPQHFGPLRCNSPSHRRRASHLIVSPAGPGSPASTATISIQRIRIPRLRAVRHLGHLDLGQAVGVVVGSGRASRRGFTIWPQRPVQECSRGTAVPTCARRLPATIFRINPLPCSGREKSFGRRWSGPTVKAHCSRARCRGSARCESASQSKSDRRRWRRRRGLSPR